MKIETAPALFDVMPKPASDTKTKVDIANSYTSLQDHMQYALPSMVVGASHDLANGTFWDVEPEEVSGKLAESGLDDFASYYLKHNEGARLAGTLAFSFVPVIGATRLIKAGNMVDKALGNLGKTGEVAQSLLISSGKTMNERVQLLSKTDFAKLSTNRLSSTEAIKLEMQQSRLAVGADILKESVAAEAVLYSLYYDEKTAKEGTNPFFTDSLLQNIAFAAIPTALFTGGAFLIAGSKMKNAIDHKLAEGIADAINIHGVATEKAFTRPGDRGLFAAAMAQNIQAEEQYLKSNLPQAARNEASSRLNTHNAALLDVFGEMGRDRPFGPAISPTLNPATITAESQTMAKFLTQDATASVGLSYVTKYTDEVQKSIPKFKKAELSRLAKQEETLTQELKGIDAAVDPEAYDVALAKLNAKQQEFAHMDTLFAAKISYDGVTISKLEDSPISILDNMKNVHHVEEDGWYRTTDAMQKDVGAQIAVSKTGKLSVEFTEAQKKSIADQGRRFTVLNDDAVRAEVDNFALQDMRLSWNLGTPNSLGGRVFDGFDEVTQDALHEWKKNSVNSTLREWNETAPQKIDAIQDAFRAAGFHARLKQSGMADSDGFITVFRGEPIKGAENDLVSVSTKASFAHTAFGGAKPGNRTVKYRAHIDDVVAPMDTGAAHEFEFIVRNYSQRVNAAHEIAAGNKFAQLTDKQIQTAWAISQKRLWNQTATDIGGLKLGARSSIVEIDYAIEMLKKAETEGVALDIDSRLQFEKFSGTQAEMLKHLQYESLVRKFDFYQQQMLESLAARANIGQKGKINIVPPKSVERIAELSNIPTNYAFGKHPILALFDAHLPNVGGQRVDLRSFYPNMDALTDGMRGLSHKGELSEARQAIEDFDMRGLSLRFDRDKDAVAAIALWDGSKLQSRIGPDLLNGLLESRRMAMLDGLANQTDGPLVAGVVRELTAIPEAFSAMSKPQFLVGGTERGHSKILTQAFNFGGVRVLQTVNDVVGLAKRNYDKVTNALFTPHNRVFENLVSPSNHGSLVAFSVAKNALRKGWDIVEMVAEEGGKKVLRLDPNSARNARLWQDTFGESMESAGKVAEFMPSRDANGKAVRVVLDDVAAEGLLAVQKLSHDYLDNLNAIRSERGLRAINKRAFHVPFHNLNDTNQVFILDQAGNVAQQISGPTAKAAMDTAQKNIEELVKVKGFRGSLATPDQLRNSFDSAHLEWEPVSNFGSSGKQTGGIKGLAAPEIVEVNPDSVRSIVHQLQSNYDSIFRYTTSTMFEGELDFAARAKLASSYNEAIKGTRGTEGTNETIWDHYANAIMQRSGISKNSAVGGFHAGFERVADKALAHLWDSYAKYLPQTKTVNEKTRQAYITATGNEQPFFDLADMIARTQKTAVPPTSRDAFEHMNRLATNVSLRVLDFGMPVVNFASMLATVPAVMKALRRMPGETLDAYNKRAGIYGDVIGEEFVMPNPWRLATGAMHDVWQPEFQAFMKKAAAKGMFDQEAAERIAFLTAPFETKSQAARRKIIDKLSIATDWSEKMSRAVSFGLAASVAKRQMGMNDDGAMIFAHKMANSIIGDYRSINKPQIFQGAAGMPFGLFTTWSWNLLQRVYGDLEGGRMGAVAMQAVLQQLYFGAESLPGAELFFGPLTTSYDGKTNIVDRLDEAYGHDAANFLLSGGISSLTGLAVQNRANISFPAVFGTGDLAQKAPAIGVYSQFGQGMNEIYASFKSNSGFNSTQIAEAISVYGVNGALKNTMQFGLGYSVDKSHNLITADTRTAENVIARIIELKTQTENRKMQELRRDAIQKSVYKDRVAGLKDALMTRVRAGDLTQESIEPILQNYIRAGGTADGFRTVIREAAIGAYVEKPMQLLLERLKTNKDENGSARLLLEYGDGLGD